MTDDVKTVIADAAGAADSSAAGGADQSKAAATETKQPDQTGKDTKAKPGKAGDLAKTVVAGDGAGDDHTAATVWPEDWRTHLAGGDAAKLKRLERFGDPKALLDSYLNAEKKLSAKQTSPAKPGKDASPEEVKAWREAQGIPETPDKYALKLKGDRVLGDDDKPIADDFAKAAHAAGLNNEQVSAAFDWYLDLQERQQSDIIDEDNDHAAASVKALKEDWGPQAFKQNMAAIRFLFEGAPEMEQAITLARMPNGRQIGNDADAIRFLTKLALEVNPVSTLIPVAGSEGKGLEDSIEAIRKTMRDDPDTYWGDEKMQARYRDLIAARDKMNSRGKAA